jgi:hypothetical protein
VESIADLFEQANRQGMSTLERYTPWGSVPHTEVTEQIHGVARCLLAGHDPLCALHELCVACEDAVLEDIRAGWGRSRLDALLLVQTFGGLLVTGHSPKCGDNRGQPMFCV